MRFVEFRVFGEVSENERNAGFQKSKRADPDRIDGQFLHFDCRPWNVALSFVKCPCHVERSQKPIAGAQCRPVRFGGDQNYLADERAGHQYRDLSSQQSAERNDDDYDQPGQFKWSFGCDGDRDGRMERIQKYDEVAYSDNHAESVLGVAMNKNLQKKKGNRNGERGFTLVELLFTVLLLPLLCLSIYLVLTMANTIFHTNNIYSQLNQSVMQSLRSIDLEIGQTSPNASPSHLSVTTDLNNNSVVTFQIPVDWDNDGDADTGGLNPQVEWGAYDQLGQKQSGRLGAWIRYSVTGSQLFRVVLNSGQVPIAGLSRIVANSIQQFRVSQNQNVLTMTLTLQATDAIGQAGRSRTIHGPLSSNTILRNAVN